MNMRILSADYGEKRIGLAISDEGGKLARRFKTIENKGADNAVTLIKAIISREKINKIIIGIPIGLKVETAQTEKTKNFILALNDEIDIPILSVNEVFTSKMAEKNLLSAGIRGKELKKVIDQEAARIILQEYLDKENSNRK